MPTALVLRAAGTNCEQEACRAFERAGATADLVHLDRVLADPRRLDAADIICFPGGFSFGDDVASGRIFAMHVRQTLYPTLRAAVDRGAPIIGICNGFQVLVQIGLLPGCPGGEWPVDAPPRQTLGLAENAGARFIDQWSTMVIDPQSPCIWTRGLADLSPDIMMYPSAHGEGRLVGDDELLIRLERAGQAPLVYADNFNGSARGIAGVCDPTGRVLGLMPHPERYLAWHHHPFWTRLDESQRRGETPGLRLFRNAVEAVAPASV